MDFKHFTPPPEPPKGEPPPYAGPTKEQILRRIESQYYDASQANEKDQCAVLDKRYAIVSRAVTDPEAFEAYREACSTLPDAPDAVPPQPDSPLSVEQVEADARRAADEAKAKEEAKKPK